MIKMKTGKDIDVSENFAALTIMKLLLNISSKKEMKTHLQKCIGIKSKNR
jgi:hypothetical protein